MAAARFHSDCFVCKRSTRSALCPKAPDGSSTRVRNEGNHLDNKVEIKKKEECSSSKSKRKNAWNELKDKCANRLDWISGM